MSQIPCDSKKCKEKEDCARQNLSSKNAIRFNYDSNIKNGKCPYFVPKEPK